MRQESVFIQLASLAPSVDRLFLVLRLEPNDQDILQTKLFLLLQTEQYAAALTLTDGNDKYAYERAYSLYRTNKESEARSALEATKHSKGEDDRGVQHLEAQLVRGSSDALSNLYSMSLHCRLTARAHTRLRLICTTNC
jgi:hypothetical protein